jgi:hypothetical protein
MTSGDNQARDCRTRQAILVLGMHRSGTSALTRALSLLGAALPKHVARATPSNEAGHWEPERLVHLHDEMLGEAGDRWDNWRAFDPSALGAARFAHYKAEIAHIIAAEYDEAPLILIKDPRICRFVPLYQDVLGSLGIEPRLVLVHRNPLAVMKSLQARDGMTPGFAALVWLRHVLDVELATRDKTRVVVSYENLLDHPAEVLRRIGEALDITWPNNIESAAAEVVASIRKDLQHQKPEATETLAGISDWISEIQNALVAMGKSRLGTLPAFDRIRKDLQRGIDVFAQVEKALRAELERKAKEIAVLSKIVEEKQQHIVERDTAIQVLTGELDNIRRSRAWKLAVLLRHLWSVLFHADRQ